MDYGICLTAVYPQAIEDSELLISLIRKVAGDKLFQCVEYYFEGSIEEEIKIHEVIKECGLSSVYLAGFEIKRGKWSITASDEQQRRDAVELLKKQYEHACRLGADKVVILSGPVEENVPEEKVVEQARRSLQEIDIFCTEIIPEIALEFFPTKREPFLALGNTEMVKKVYEHTDWKHIGITFDTSHVAQIGEDVVTSFRTLMPWTHHLHLANSMSADKTSPLYGDKHPLFTLENGDFSVEQIKTVYRQLQEEGLLKNVEICSVEVISRGDEESYYTEIVQEASTIWERRNG
ncbi:MAG: TIM barrel protein [Lachnospiraceae bacterium]|nr:TIM barrel protein [Lachnospiraceae bacterium]